MNEKSCYNCKNNFICKISDAMTNLLNILRFTAIDNDNLHTDLSEFIAKNCKSHEFFDDHFDEEEMEDE